MKWIALRYFNAAGAWPDGSIGEDHGDEIHLIPLAIRAANGGTPLKVFGEDYPTPDGTCQRDYIHVCDLASAHICALEAIERGAPSGAYNVGTGTPHSVRSVIDTVSRVVGRPVAWQSAPRRPGDPAGLMQPVTACNASWGGVRNIPSWKSSSGMRGSGTRCIHGGIRVSHTDR